MDIQRIRKERREGKVRLSKKGSIIFYSLLALLLIFFIIMYIKWRMLYV